MSPPQSRLSSILSHLVASPPSSASPTPLPPYIHSLSPTHFLPRAAAIEPRAEAIYHITANDRVLRRSYEELADRARGLAYYLLKHRYRRVGIVAPNTPAFLESIFGVNAAGGVIVPVNYRLKAEDVSYILGWADVECVVVDREFVGLLESFRTEHPNVPLIVDLVRNHGS